jgi:glycopeptide antibiotics resistance protein
LYFKSTTKIINYKTPVVLFFVSLVFGIGIEWSQQVLTTSRKGDVLDVISNISGAFTALVILLSANYYSNKKTKI